jgi:hypothetical protein
MYMAISTFDTPRHLTSSQQHQCFLDRSMPKVCRPKNVPRQKCRFCNNLDPRDHVSTFFNDKKKATAQLSLAIDSSRLKRVSEGGCRFCLLLCQALDKSVGEWRKNQGDVVRVEIEEGKPVVLRFGDDLLQVYAPQFSGNCSQNLPWRSLGEAVEGSFRTDSDESYDFINKCLRTCLSHTACNSITSRVFPTRVLDVGKGEKDPIRIHVPCKFGFKYIALSMSFEHSSPTFVSLIIKRSLLGHRANINNDKLQYTPTSR